MTDKFWWNRNSHTIRMAVLTLYRDWAFEDIPESQAEKLDELYSEMQDSFAVQANLEAFGRLDSMHISPIDFKLCYPNRSITKRGDSDATAWEID